MAQTFPSRSTDAEIRSEPTNIPGQGLRSIISLLIFFHLFFVVVGVFGNESVSELQRRLRRVLVPYSRLLNLDPQFLAGFHLTHAMEFEDDHQLAVQVDGESEERVLPPPAIGPDLESLGFRRQRWRMLTRRVGMSIDEGNDEAVAELARSLGEAIFSQSEARHLVFVCRRFRPPSLLEQGELPEHVTDASTVLYEADVLIDSSNRVRVHKRVAASEAAGIRSPE